MFLLTPEKLWLFKPKNQPGIYLQISKIAYKLIIVEIYRYAKIY